MVLHGTPAVMCVQGRMRERDREREGLTTQLPQAWFSWRDGAWALGSPNKSKLGEEEEWGFSFFLVRRNRIGILGIGLVN